MAKIRLAPGAGTNVAGFILSGAGAVTGASADQFWLQIVGWAGMAIGLIVLISNITVNDKRWWQRWFLAQENVDLAALSTDRAEAIRELVRIRSESRPWLNTVTDDIAETDRLNDLIRIVGPDENAEFYLNQIRAHDSQGRLAQCVLIDNPDVEAWRNSQLRYHFGLRNLAIDALDGWLRGRDDRKTFMKARKPFLALDVDNRAFSGQEIFGPNGMRLRIRLAPKAEKNG